MTIETLMWIAALLMTGALTLAFGTLVPGGHWKALSGFATGLHHHRDVHCVGRGGVVAPR